MILDLVDVNGDCIALHDNLADTYIWQACFTQKFFHTWIPSVLCLAGLTKEQEWIYRFRPLRNSDNLFRLCQWLRASFAIVLTGKLYLSKSVQTNKSVAEDQMIRNNQVIFRKVFTGSYSVVCCILWIANCERNINQVDTDSSLTDDVQMY